MDTEFFSSIIFYSYRKDHMFSPLSSVNVINYIDQFWKVNPTFQSWEKPTLT